MLVYVAPKQDTPEVQGDLQLTFRPNLSQTNIQLAAAQIGDDGVISTGRSSGNAAWGGLRGKAATGAWKLALQDTQDLNDIRKRVVAGEVEDIFIVITFFRSASPLAEHDLMSGCSCFHKGGNGSFHVIRLQKIQTFAALVGIECAHADKVEVNAD